jgi:hypothetical protein
MMNMTNEPEEHSEPEKRLETEAEKILGAAGYGNDGVGKRIRPQGADQAQTSGGWYRNE